MYFLPASSLTLYSFSRLISGKNYALQIGSRKDTDSAGRHFGQTIPYGGAGFN